MTWASDTCKTGSSACTWKTTAKNKFSKFFSCRANSMCLVQPGLNDYIIYGINTAPQTIVVSKIQDVGPCKFVLLNSMKQKSYLNMTTDEPLNTVGFFQEIKNFMIPETQSIDDTYIEMKPAVVYELNANSHYMVGVVNLRAGVTYKLTFWRDISDYSAIDD